MNSDSPADRFVIALDGPAGSGKSSVASILAQKIGCIHADSGAMYRLLTLAMIEQLGAGKDPTEFAQKFSDSLDQVDAAALECGVQVDAAGRQQNLLHGQDVGDQIRSLEVTARIKYIADERSFREQVNRMLHDLAGQTSLIADGRDIGSVVFPNTPWKFYLDASVAIRTQRRLLEMREQGIDNGISEAELAEQIARRDEGDRNRPFGALQVAPGAILIDTSPMSRNDVVHYILSQLQITF